jgi:hypothetical protein
MLFRLLGTRAAPLRVPPLGLSARRASRPYHFSISTFPLMTQTVRVPSFISVAR